MRISLLRKHAPKIPSKEKKIRDYEGFIEPSIARMLEGELLGFWAALAIDEHVRRRDAAASAP